MRSSAPPHVLVPAQAAAWIAGRAGGWGYLDLKISQPEQLAVVAGYSDRHDVRQPCVDPLLEQHCSRPFQRFKSCGLWYRVRPEVHEWWPPLAARGCGLPTNAFREFIVPDAWVAPKAGGSLLLAISGEDQQEVSAWWVMGDELWPASSEVVDVGLDPLARIEREWPVKRLNDKHIAIVGAGSIGGAAASGLAAAGVGRLTLVDPQRLEHRNVARHVCSTGDIGRFKVKALAEHLLARYPGVEVHPLVADVERDADSMRPVFAAADVIVVASDGVLSRRVANHLGRRAGKPSVFAAVLADGAFGEVIRSRPQDACLLCLRADLIEQGCLDPEPALDADYGTGTSHRPMTAAPSDLRLVGELTAKVTLATLLERAGHATQRLPGGWLLIGLQPDATFDPPFDLTRAGEMRWLPLPRSRQDCISCVRP